MALSLSANGTSHPKLVEGQGADERRKILDGAAFIYCRETKTLEILRYAGVKPPVLEFGPDGCFGIDVRDDERGLATMKKLGLEDRKFITIQLRTNTAIPLHSPSPVRALGRSGPALTYGVS